MAEDSSMNEGQRALQHNHIFQVKPRNAQFDHADCPACSSIDLAVMDSWYAQAWHARLKVERALLEETGQPTSTLT